MPLIAPESALPRDARTTLGLALPALSAYAAVRLLGMLVFGVAAAFAGEDAHRLLSKRWDAAWYRRIAQDGYGHVVTTPTGEVHSDLAFFPLLPFLERLGSVVVPIGEGNVGLLIAWCAGLAAAWGIYSVGAYVANQRAGVFLAALWGASPTAYVQSMAYTESLFTALAAWSLFCVLRGRWAMAGALCVLAGLTRPSAVALIAALGIAAVVHVVRERRLEPQLVLGVALAPLGWLAFVVYVGVKRGAPGAYFDVQAEWGNHVDGGVALARFALGLHPMATLALAATLALLAHLLVLVGRRQPLPLVVYSVVIVVISLIGAGYFGSRPRLLMPAFPLLLPPAIALARWRPPFAVATVGAIAVASAVYGAFALLGDGPP